MMTVLPHRYVHYNCHRVRHMAGSFLQDLDNRYSLTIGMVI